MIAAKLLVLFYNHLKLHFHDHPYGLEFHASDIALQENLSLLIHIPPMLDYIIKNRVLVVNFINDVSFNEPMLYIALCASERTVTQTKSFSGSHSFSNWLP